MTNRPIRRKNRLLGVALAVVCCVGFSAASFAQAADDELRAAREHGQNATGLRTVNCLIKVRGVEYSNGFCTFIPSEAKDGSFTIGTIFDKHWLHARVVLSVPGSKEAVASWSGPNNSSGGALVELGQAHSEGACWRVGDEKGKDETRLCAWNSKLAVDEPTPKEPPLDSKEVVYYGMREGMYDAIEARSGMDTDHARIVTKKSRGAAIIVCRGDNDFTAACIAQTLLLAPTPLLAANCPTGTFADALGFRSGDCDHCQPPQSLKFLGKNPHSDQGRAPDFLIQNSDGSVMDGSWSSTYSFAEDAFRLLCPETLKKAGTAQQ